MTIYSLDVLLFLFGTILYARWLKTKKQNKTKTYTDSGKRGGREIKLRHIFLAGDPEEKCDILGSGILLKNRAFKTWSLTPRRRFPLASLKTSGTYQRIFESQLLFQNTYFKKNPFVFECKTLVHNIMQFKIHPHNLVTLCKYNLSSKPFFFFSSSF